MTRKDKLAKEIRSVANHRLETLRGASDPQLHIEIAIKQCVRLAILLAAQIIEEHEGVVVDRQVLESKILELAPALPAWVADLEEHRKTKPTCATFGGSSDGAQIGSETIVTLVTKSGVEYELFRSRRIDENRR